MLSVKLPNEVGNEWRVIEENLPDFLKPHVVELAQIINSRFKKDEFL